MSILADHQILRRATATPPMIDPFLDVLVKPEGGGASYGLSSYGYDARLGRKFKVFSNTWNAIVDPKNFDQRCFVAREGDFCTIPPNSFVLAETVEWFNMPRDLLAMVVGKSTYARCGIIANVTPIEPEWRGRLTLELANTTPLPAVVYAGDGICQVIFYAAHSVCKTSYADRAGKYQDQPGVTGPR